MDHPKRGLRTIVLGAWWWPFGFPILTGVDLVVAATMAYFTPRLEIFSLPPPADCVGCSSAAPPPLTWTPGILGLLLVGLALAGVGLIGIATGLARFRRGGRSSQPDTQAGSVEWTGFLSGVSGWVLGTGLLCLTVVDPFARVLPNGSYVAVSVGSVVLLTLSGLVWSHGLRQLSIRGGKTALGPS